MKPSSARLSKLILISFIMLVSFLSFQNCAKKNGDDSLYSLGGEPYPGLDPVEGDTLIRYQSHNQVCADAKVSDEIVRLVTQEYVETRKDCMNTSNATSIESFTDILNDTELVPISFSYQTKRYERLNPMQ